MSWSAGVTQPVRSKALSVRWTGQAVSGGDLPDRLVTVNLMPRNPGSRRGSYSVGVARRQGIAGAAARRFAVDGYHRTALTRAAEDVGITEGGLLHHFRSKKHLLLAVMEHRFTVDIERVQFTKDRTRCSRKTR